MDPPSRTSGADPGRPRLVVVVAARTGPRAVAACCDDVRALLRRAPGAVVECDVGQLCGSAADVVEALARLRLVALECGGRLRIRHAGPALLSLLDLLGFADLLPVADPPKSRHPAAGGD